MHKNSRGFALVVPLILVLIAAGVAGYLAYQSGLIDTPFTATDTKPQPSPTPDPTADWETYSNSIYGFSLKYPANFFIEEWPKEDDSFSLSISDQEDYGGPLSLKEGRLAISIIVGGADFKRSDYYYGGYQWTKSVLDDLSHAPIGEERGHKYETNIKLSNINGSNYSGIKYKAIPKEGIETEGFPLLSAALINNGKTILISAGVGGYNPNTVFSKPYTDTFDQIISTFEFVDQDSAFTCPQQKTIDCAPCTGARCPLSNPQYCHKGTPQYNWIIENCPDVEIINAT